ncbi:MAG: protoglobin domain-containing protein [Cyanobacteriota bacterium]
MTIEPLKLLETLARRVQLEQADKEALQGASNWGKQIASQMADVFYSYLGRDEEMNQILNGSEGRLQRLHKTFEDWFVEMFTGIDNWGKIYAERRWKIGLVHVRLGINPQHVVPAMSVVIKAVREHSRQDNQPETLENALSKVCMIDLAFMEQAYVEVSSQAVLQETGWTQALFQRLIATGAAAI